MSKREMHLLNKARVKEVQAGIESFSTPALALMQRSSPSEHPVLRWAQEAQVRVVYNVLDGFPGEEPKWYEDMADLVASIVHLEPPRYDLVAVELHRFSPLLDRRLRSAAPLSRFPVPITHSTFLAGRWTNHRSPTSSRLASRTGNLRTGSALQRP